MAKSIQVAHEKARTKLEVNVWLLAIAFTLFTFIIAINPSLVRGNIYLSLQLTLAIPLMMSSIFARAKMVYSATPTTWDGYAFFTFIFSYACLINVVGILLSTLVSTGIGIVFWGVNIFLALLYSLLEVFEDNEKFGSRFWKDATFIAIILAAGLFPVIGLY